jgi:uncharacterized repeat protein (TIGR03833 family)
MLSNMNANNRRDINPGARVRIVLKQDQRSGKLTEGVVRDILTRSSTHPHGIKVRLTNGEIGRVKEMCGGGTN